MSSSRLHQSCSSSSFSSGPNTQIRPVSCQVDSQGHLTVGGCDTEALASQFGTPLWVVDEKTIVDGASAFKEGLNSYPNSQVLYAGKAFLCLAMCRLIEQLGLGLDVVSEGELFTAQQAGFPADRIYMHGNNKSEAELVAGLNYGDVTVIVDNLSELEMLARVAAALGKVARVLFRVIPGVEPDTHQHIKTGQHDSKFGIPLPQVPAIVQRALTHKSLSVEGIHSHIGSQIQAIEPYLDNIDILAELCAQLKNELEFVVTTLDVGCGVAIKYTEKDAPVGASSWSAAVSERVQEAFKSRRLLLPKLLIEPGRSIIGPAGVTLYRVGHCKDLPGGASFIAVDGGMADNPRPIMYQSRYTACIANRAEAAPSAQARSIVGKYCESGDIIIKETYLDAKTGDLIAIFGTGAYNFSMASNYNRSPRPACVLVADGSADLIVARESNEDLTRQDRLPPRLSR